MIVFVYLVEFLILHLFLSSVQCVYVISGITADVDASNGRRPIRPNIQSFQYSGPAWDLYILALHQFMQLDPSNPESYYRIAGIHGYPLQPWDGVVGSYSSGYCTHSSILFGPWHRVYLALFENILWTHAQGIAADYPAQIRPVYIAAAASLRIPYWDFANLHAIPDAASSQLITVLSPTGPSTIANPLYSYKMPPSRNPDDFPPTFQAEYDLQLSRFNETFRNPLLNGVSDIRRVNAQLNATGASREEKLYLLVARQSNYAPYSNKGYIGDLRQDNYDSSEAIHDEVHTLLGGFMAYVPFAAFDPLFWLLHTNVDRIEAIWQAIYPSSYVIPQANLFGTYTEAVGTVEDDGTAMTPFHQTNTTFYDAEAARKTRSFGYTYPELLDWDVTADQLASNARSAFKAVYAPDQKKRSSKAKAGKVRHEAVQPKTVVRAQSDSGNGTDVTIISRQREWLINIKLDKIKSNQSLSINFYLGDPPIRVADWVSSANFVGAHLVFAGSDFKIGEMASLGQVPLTERLVDLAARGQLRNLLRNTVVEYLKRNLKWQVATYAGAVADAAVIEEGDISVVDQVVLGSPEPDQFGTYGNVQSEEQLRWRICR